MTEKTFASRFIDGASAAVGLKTTELNDISSRVGALSAGAVIGIFAYGKLAVKPALKELPQAQRAALLGNIPLGSVVIG